MNYDQKLKKLKRIFATVNVVQLCKNSGISRATVYRLLEGREIKPSTVDRMYAAINQGEK
jgi:predicted transcriptional regulator